MTMEMTATKSMLAD